MAKRFVDKEHLKWVTKLPCTICKAGFLTHSKAIQAHHLLRPSTGPRQGVKSSDKEVIPLCYYHHSLLHTKHGTEANFFRHYGMPEDFGIKYAKELWERKTYIDDEDDELPF